MMDDGGMSQLFCYPPFLPFQFQNHIISLHIWEDMVSYNVGMQDMQKNKGIFLAEERVWPAK